MIFWKLFYTFCKIGIFNFGGGYAMISLIQNEVVVKNGWLSANEFADIIAISQMTPGPLGINVATYSGYTAVLNAGYDPWLGVLGAGIASFSLLLLPMLFILLTCKFLQKHKEHPLVKSILSVLRPTVIGLIAASAILLITPDTFGSMSENPIQLVASVLIFAGIFVGAYHFKKSPILLLLISGIVGLILYL
ncbi:MAG: chromate transporter [Bacteroidales bacterium]|nr:chromate transporter [Bacteroidales bacterium]